MIVRQFFDPDTSTYTYIVADEASGKALIIDPVIEQLDRDLRLLGEMACQLIYSLDTHVHADHITASGELRKQTQCETVMSVHAGVGCADIAIKEGEVLQVGGIEISILETPGHTPTCISFVAEKNVFCGDALLIRGCGRTDFQQGNAGDLYDSITKKLFALGDDFLVRPGHDYRGMLISTIGEEKQFNPRLKLNREDFIQYMTDLKLPHPAKIQEALPANLACGEVQQ